VAYAVVLFDLDGTVTNPIEGITKSVQYALAKFDIHEDTEALLPFVGPPLNKSFVKYYSFHETKAVQAVGYYREYFERRGIYENEVLDGMPELLQRLRDANKTLYVVTSKPTYYAEQIVRHFGLDKYFAKVIGSEMDLTNTEKATLVRIATNLHPDEDKRTFVMIGDREHDIIGAKENDIDSIGLTYGAGSREEIVNAGPTYVAHTVRELERLLMT
jgi:phosphoglycolate phosphatase